MLYAGNKKKVEPKKVILMINLVRLSDFKPSKKRNAGLSKLLSNGNEIWLAMKAKRETDKTKIENTTKDLIENWFALVSLLSLVKFIFCTLHRTYL